MSSLRPVTQPLAYRIADAAEAVGSSESVLKTFIASGDIPKKYINYKPVVLATDLQKWLDSLPEFPPNEVAS